MVFNLNYLNNELDLSYIITLSFIWKTATILFASLGPPWIFKVLRKRIRPPSYTRIQES
jgi:phospholipid-translocating ATPase